MAQIFFTIVQIIWGAPQTLLGLVLYAATTGCPRFHFYGARGTVWKHASSVSLGLFIFVAEQALTSTPQTLQKHTMDASPHVPQKYVAIPTDASATAYNSRAARAQDITHMAAISPLTVHEYGHCIQSLIFGPLYLVVFGLPSFIWAMLPALRKRRTRTGKSYYSFYTERFANYLATHIIKERPC